jgi:glyoxylase-like metal-dependent hydrolase (beta-lactamase superfamily II)
MRRTVVVRLAAWTLFLSAAWFAYTQTPAPSTPRPATAQKVKDNLYMIQGEGGNVAAYLTDEGVILVDDMYDRNYATVMEQVGKLSDKPVRYVINTHHHDDHAGANNSMPGSVELIAHRNARTQMLRIKQPGLPRVTFADQLEVHLGGKEVRAYHFGRGHTDGDVIVYFPELKVIHTGDIFLAGRFGQPYMDFAAGGSAVEWTQVIDETAKLDFDTIIPGHGPLGDRAGLAKWRADFITMRDRVHGMVQRGESKESISKVLIDEFKWPNGGLAIGQVDAFIAEMKATPQLSR